MSSTTEAIRIPNPPGNDEQGQLKSDPPYVRRRWALKASGDCSLPLQGRKCSRCGAPFGRFYNTGAACRRCKHRVCRQCREVRSPNNDNNKGNVGIDWICIDCHKILEFRTTVEWMFDSPVGKRVTGRDHSLSPLDILKHSIRRAWTINGPPARWSASRKSPEFRLYRSLPIRGREYRDASEIDEENNAKNIEQLRECLSLEDARRDIDLEHQQQQQGRTPKNEPNERGNKKPETPKSEEKGIASSGIVSKVRKTLVTGGLRGKTKSVESVPGLVDRSPQRVSLLKAPKIVTKLGTPENKPAVKHEGRKSNIPIFRRSSKEFEDIRNPQESPKRSLIPQRYRGSTDDLRRSREDISAPSFIPKLMSPRNKEDKLKRQDSKDDVRFSSKSTRTKDEGLKSPLVEGAKSIPKIPRRENKELAREQSATDLHSKESSPLKIPNLKPKQNNDEETQPTTEESTNVKMLKELTVEGERYDESNSKSAGDNGNKKGIIAEGTREKEEMAILRQTENSDKVAEVDEADFVLDQEGKEQMIDPNLTKKIDDVQVIRRKFSKEEFSNTDDTDDVSNRRCSSHLSPEASPLSTRSSKYSPRESESEPTPALPRKTGGDTSSASQRIRDAITRTRRESNSSTRYESSGSESVRLSESGFHGYVDLARRVKFLGTGSVGPSIGSCDEVIQRDSATSAGEDEPYDDHSRDPCRIGAGSTSSRVMLRRRRQFDAQGSRRRGRSHARSCCGEDLQALQTLHVIGRGGGRQSSPPDPDSQGHGQSHVQEAPIIDYRRLVFISSDSSSGREEDDADSSCSGSSYLNGLQHGGHAQGLEDCDWDYFESGTLPLPPGALSINSAGIGTDLISQDWSCCLGKGSASCQACGSSKSANVLPVPVPIPVPVPYPVPVPASMWTSDFAAASSMIGQDSALEHSLRLRGDPSSPWFAWHTRFTQPLQGNRFDPRLTSFDPSNFIFPSDQVYPRFHEDLTSLQNSTVDIQPPSVSEASVDNHEDDPEKSASKPTKLEDEVPEPVAPVDNIKDEVEEVPIEPEKNKEEDNPAESKDQEESQEEEKNQEEICNRMYRHSPEDSRSSSGRSSADSSDLEDSASHRFSRVFVVNDDSLTSDNDIEDNEDSDSAEGGVILKRVTAILEDEPVILQKIRMLNDDGESNASLEKGYEDENEKEKDGEKDRKDRINSMLIEDEESYSSKKEGRYSLNEDNLADGVTEIYLADSEETSDNLILLKSIKALDPDCFDVNGENNVTAKFVEISNDNEKSEGLVTDEQIVKEDNFSIRNVDISESPDVSSGSQGPKDTYSMDSIMMPDSLETSIQDLEDSIEMNFANQYDGPTFSTPICPRKPFLNSATRNGDIKNLSPLKNVNSTFILEERKNTEKNLSTNSIPGSATSESNTTGSEVSSDELHDYEVSTLERRRNDETFTAPRRNSATDYVNLSSLSKTFNVTDRSASYLGDVGGNDSLGRNVDDLMSSKIQNIFKSVSDKSGERPVTETGRMTLSASAHDERLGAVRGESQRVGVVETGGGIEGGGEVERGTARFRSVERRPPTRKENGLSDAKDSNRDATNIQSSNYPNSIGNSNSNKYTSLVMITQGTYQPVNVITSDTTTLLQPEVAGNEPPNHQGLASFFLTLDAVTEPKRNNGQGTRKPWSLKRFVTSNEPEVDSGLSVGSASESDEVQSVKNGSRQNLHYLMREENVPKESVPSVDIAATSVDDLNRFRMDEYITPPPAAVIIEEGLADDDSWVEEISHDEDEQSTNTATEESSDDEANNLGDREEELRGYHRQAIDFTLHTIVEESCEESEAEATLGAANVRKRFQRPTSTSELEKYFFFGLGGDGNASNGSREVDSLSETSSIYSEGLESLGHDDNSQNSGQGKPSGDFVNTSRLEKYFLSEFMVFDQDRRDSDGSVGSDSEGRPSPEAQRRKRLVRARGTGRSHSSSLDNLLALAQNSQNSGSHQNSLQDLSLNQDAQESQSGGSSTETDGATEAPTPAFGNDGQFDTVKRKKWKIRNPGTLSPRVVEDRTKTPEPRDIIAEILDGPEEVANSDDERAKTPQPENPTHFLVNPSSQAEHVNSKNPQSVSAELSYGRSKQSSRDSGFVGSCDDLLQQRKSPTEGNTSETKNQAQSKDIKGEETRPKEKVNSPKVDRTVDQTGPPQQMSNNSLSRKDSFNNWSSDEETNLMMSKMRQFFKTMVANSNGQGQTPSTASSATSPAPSPRLSGYSSKGRHYSQNRTKPPQLVYFENELTRLMKTVPGIRDEQVREIVEYLSSEDTWSDSYDSSDYTSSDLEGAAGGRRSALQEQISQSCQQIISKFDTNSSENGFNFEKDQDARTSTPQQPGLGRDTAFVYQKLVQSFTKMTGDGGSSDTNSTPHSSPPLIAKVMHHIGSRLVALMHEVSEGNSTVQLHSNWRRYQQYHRTPSSASTTEDDDSTSDSTNPSSNHPLPRSKSHDPLLLLNGHPAAGNVSQEGEEREASDYERFSWRGSFESALMAADSRTKLSLLACSGDVNASASASALVMAAKRRSAGDLLFNPKSFSREQLDRVRSCGSIGGGTGGVAGVSSGSIEEKIWSNRRRSSVPDANTRESGASAGDDDTEDDLEYNDSRAMTLPRGMQTAAAAAASAATNSLPRLPASAVSGSQTTNVNMHKSHSVYHFLPHSGVKSARYRPPGFARNNGSSIGGPKRAVSAPGLQISGSQTPGSKRDNSRSRRQQTMSINNDDGSSLSEACSTPIIGASSRTNSTHTTMEMDDIDRSLHTGHLATRASLSSLGARSDSMASVYSGAGEGRWCGSVAVRGEVEFSLQYDYKQLALEVHVTHCRDLAPVDVKRNRSDPYVKVYLLPDKSKSGKRKTKVKKHTLNPVFDETLKFHTSLNGLETRTLWLTVWHSDMFGRNDFLGEVRMPLENKIFDDPRPQWYPLQERTEPFDDPVSYKGEVIIGLKFVPPDPVQQERERDSSAERRGSSKARKNWSRGALHVLVKEARNLQTRAKHSGTCDPFCKSYLLPDKGRSGKQKTGVVRRSTGSPVWNHTFVYKDVSLQELADRGLELTVWDHDRIASNEFLGGVRFNLGTGKHYGKTVDWMDATGREMSLWQNMLERPNFWVEGAVTLRPNLHNHVKSGAS